MNRVLVWGSEGGIGGAVVREFESRGWQVTRVARSLTAASSETEGFFQADFSRFEEVERVGKDLLAAKSRFEVLVYAAGDIGSQKIAEADPKRWKEILDNNLTGVFHTLRVSLPLLAEEGHIFLLGAVSERLRLPGLSSYVAAKSGLEALAVTLAKEERKKKVTLVRPGAVATPLWEKVPFRQPAHTYSPEQVAQQIWEAYQTGQTGQLDLT